MLRTAEDTYLLAWVCDWDDACVRYSRDAVTRRTTENKCSCLSLVLLAHVEPGEETRSTCMRACT